MFHFDDILSAGLATHTLHAPIIPNPIPPSLSTISTSLQKDFSIEAENIDSK